MIALVQRVTRAEVEVDGAQVASIGPGLLILLGVAVGDGQAQAEYLAAKISAMRIFDNAEGNFDLSIKDVAGQALVVSQFTLMGSWRKGRRPGFEKAASPQQAAPLVDAFAYELEKQGIDLKRGVFGAHMMVSLVNDGPVTFCLDTEQKEQ